MNVLTFDNSSFEKGVLFSKGGASFFIKNSFFSFCKRKLILCIDTLMKIIFKKTEQEFSVTCIRDESGTDYPSCFL